MRTVFTRYSNTTTVERELLSHSGQECEVVRELTKEEVDIPNVGPMFRIRFDDGFETDAFLDELRDEPPLSWKWCEHQDCWVRKED